MKNIISGVLIVVISFSCSFNKEIDSELFDSNEYPQQWQLIQTSINIPNEPPKEGSDMLYQEYYLILEDKSFIKTREQDGIVTQASGTYDYVVYGDEDYLELSYESDNDMVANCSIETKELLKVESDNTMIGTWWECDGPGLFYERVEL